MKTSWWASGSILPDLDTQVIMVSPGRKSRAFVVLGRKQKMGDARHDHMVTSGILMRDSRPRPKSYASVGLVVSSDSPHPYSGQPRALGD